MEVIEGDLMNLQGKVISVEADTVTIMPKHEDLKVRCRAYVIPVYSYLGVLVMPLTCRL